MKNIIIKVDGMTCSACSNHVEKYLKKQKGIIDVSVNLVLGQALIYYEDDLDLKEISKYIEESGYTYGGIYQEKEEKKKDYNKWYLIILGFLLLFIMYFSMEHMLNLPMLFGIDAMMHPDWYAVLLFVFTIPYLFYGKDIIMNGLKNFFSHSANMDTLVSLGVLVSFFYSLIHMIFILLGNHMLVENLYFESVCMILFFVKLGRYIDQNSKAKTKEAIQELVQITPQNALLKTKDGEKKVTIDEVLVGDILIVKPGMKVAVDGEITKGSAHFDESFITGESKPIKKGVSQNIVAGSINYDGYVEYKALKIGPKSTISEMVHLVLQASNSKMPIGRIADRVSSYFVPFILVMVLITFLFSLVSGEVFSASLLRMVTVLVVACPCALGLATPLAIVVSIGNAAQKGILIKSSETLEIASHIDTIVFDKTGTLTYGKLKVSQFYHSVYDDKTFLNLVANIEKNSTHPIAAAFLPYETKKLKVSQYQELTGIGIKATMNHKNYTLGNHKIIKNLKNPYQKEEEQLARAGNSLVYVLEENNIIGLIGVKDVLHKESKNTIKKLNESGYDVFMLTGDNEITANQIGQELKMKHIIANVMPSDKTKFIQELQKQGKKVAMVGDGINDAPSLATADIGISFQGSTDIAANSSHVIFMNDQIDNICTLFLIGKKTVRNIKQNLFWAFFYNILMIPLAMGLFKNFGLEINPMIASASMMISSLCVVFNALRLRKVTKKL